MTFHPALFRKLHFADYPYPQISTFMTAGYLQRTCAKWYSRHDTFN